MNVTPSQLESLTVVLPLSPFWVASGLFFLFCFFGWCVSFIGAFLHVPINSWDRALYALGAGFLASGVLSVIMIQALPDLAGEFTLVGQLFFGFLIAAPIFSVPLLQALWKTSYVRSFCSLGGGLLLAFLCLSVLRFSMLPDKPLSARPGFPVLFQDTP